MIKIGTSSEENSIKFDCKLTQRIANLELVL